MVNFVSPTAAITRRELLKAGVGLTVAAATPMRAFGAGDEAKYSLNVAEASVQLAGPPFPKTKVWACNGEVPGTLLRGRQGQPMEIEVRNALAQPITIHWHGLRIDNAMDGVPILTQQPIMPGQDFTYRFTPPDAGTYWYHSHVNTAEQIARGVYGTLIVDEAEPPQVDRDVLWVLDDWRLDNQAQIVDDFDNHRDFARAGRLGNTITVNGRTLEDFPVRSGERIRLRLVNAANARIFSLRLRDHMPWIIAHDGQPVVPYQPPGGAVEIAPAQRVDLILDWMGAPGTRVPIIDSYYPQAPFRLRDAVYSAAAPLRAEPLDAPMQLGPNPITPPTLDDGDRRDVILSGGDLGDMQRAELRGQVAGRAQLVMMGKMWAINGTVGYSMDMPPMFTFERGRTAVMHFKNRSAWPHPMHLHGHHFDVVSHSGDPAQIGRRLDTVLLGPGEESEVAFVADNPGDWLFHCHILGHAEAGLIAVVRVS